MVEKELSLQNFTAKKTEDGNLKKLTGAELIQKSIENIIKTRKGSIPSNPEFGSNLNSYLSTALDDILVETAERQLTSDVKQWEDRPDDLEIDVSKDSKQKILNVNISFSYKNETASLDLPRETLDLVNRLVVLTPEEELDASSLFKTDNIVGYINLDAEVVRI